MVFDMEFKTWKDKILELSVSGRVNDENWTEDSEKNWNDFVVLLFWSKGMLCTYWKEQNIFEEYYDTLIKTLNSLPDYGAIEITLNFLEEGGVYTANVFFKNIAYLFENAKIYIPYILSGFIRNKKIILQNIAALDKFQKHIFFKVLNESFIDCDNIDEYIAACKN